MVGLIKMFNLRDKGDNLKLTLMHGVCRLNVVLNALIDWISSSAKKHLAGLQSLQFRLEFS